MTEKRIYQLAWDSLIQKWGREHDFLEQHKDNGIAKFWGELMELDSLMREKGYDVTIES